MSNIGQLSPAMLRSLEGPKTVKDWEKIADGAETKDLQRCLADKSQSPAKRAGAAHELAQRGETGTIPTGVLLAMAQDPRCSQETKDKILAELEKRFNSDKDYSKGDDYDYDDLDKEELDKWKDGARHASSKDLRRALNDPDASPEKKMAAAMELAARGETKDIPDGLLKELADALDNHDFDMDDKTKENIKKETTARHDNHSYEKESEDIF